MLVYSDGGVGASEVFVSMTVSSLKKVLGQLQHASSSFAVETSTAKEIISGTLSERCCLLVMAGGRDLPYVEKLKGKGNENISQFVKNGGGYLGICAGAYYSCSWVQFAQGDPLLEVVGPRELSFFKGISQGPVFSGFDYSSRRGAVAADIQLTPAGKEMLNSYVGKVSTTKLTTNDDSDVTMTASGGGVPMVNDPLIKIYYEGGCHFMDDSPTDETLRNFKSLTAPPSSLPSITSPNNKNYYEVLATYAAPSENFSSFVSRDYRGGVSQRPPSALIASQYGQGRVVLSGIHFEASSDLLKQHCKDDPHVESLLPHLVSSDAIREKLLLACVKYLLSLDEHS